MSDTVISVEKVSKLYRLGEVGTGTLRHDFNRWWHRLRGKEDPNAKIGEGQRAEDKNQRTEVRSQKSEVIPALRPATSDSDPSSNSPLPSGVCASTSDFWALRDVSFEVKRGEVLGIIGRNGAGKSTLLKILSRVTSPTRGQVKVKGRIASLLEVGTGFHPELTGRENIYLNGAILGMRKGEITSKLDEIIDFSGCEQFIDTPVKRYSSGMYVRLGFAVAAHLDPEILVVDEVLAVGDAMFQRKCLGKIKSVSGQGRAVLFVSHNMAALADICQTATVLNTGQVTFRGRVREGIENYLSQTSMRNSRITFPPSADCDVNFRSFSVTNSEGRELEVFSISSPIRIQIEYELPRPLVRVQIVCHIWNIHRVHVLATADIDEYPELFENREPGHYSAEISLPPSLLGPGVYQLSVACGVPNLRLIDDREGPMFEVSAIHSHAAQWSGARQDVIVALPMRWTLSRN